MNIWDYSCHWFTQNYLFSQYPNTFQTLFWVLGIEQGQKKVCASYKKEYMDLVHLYSEKFKSNLKVWVHGGKMPGKSLHAILNLYLIFKKDISALIGSPARNHVRVNNKAQPSPQCYIYIYFTSDFISIITI